MKDNLGARHEAALIAGLEKDVFAFADGVEQADDITMLGFKLHGFVSFGERG